MAKEYKLVELTEEEYKKLKEIESATSCQCCVAYENRELCDELDCSCFSSKFAYFIEVENDK